MIDLVVDLSHWQSEINFVKMKANGIEAVILKATQGTSFNDATFASRCMAAIKAELLVGAYHFCDGSAPADQAAFFLAAAGSLPVLALDVEANSSVGNNVTIQQAAEIAGRVQMAAGRAPLIYIGRYGPSGNSTGLPNDILARCPLWIPAYHEALTPPKLPLGWNQYVLWQYTDSGVVTGIGSKCDRNRYNGTVEELRAWWQLPSICQR